ncbi:MAG: protein phosphatase CheZ [Ignavibacteriaceae bacterium]
MNAPTNMAELFNKLNDLKSVFRYGERLIPIVQSLIDFMRDTVPLLEKINSSIAESTNKIPKATNQINNVTSATELATTEILDLVDAISGDASIVEKVLLDLIKREEEKKKLQDQILSEVASLNGTASLVKKYFELSDVSVNISPIMSLFAKIKSDAYNITMSLQVQDITSQQLAAVNHLIESVQDKLASLLYNFQETSFKGAESVEFDSRGHTFNPEARYDKSDEKQQIVDSLVKSTVATQDEIDKLFS